MNHPKADLYRSERAKGKTYRKIAEEYGVSYQAVANSCGPEKEYCFRGWTAERCIYPNLRRWLNDNRVTLAGFIRKMDLVPGGAAPGRFSDYFRGVCYPGKKTIDKMLEVTGLTYEQLWATEGE